MEEEFHRLGNQALSFAKEKLAFLQEPLLRLNRSAARELALRAELTELLDSIESQQASLRAARDACSEDLSASRDLVRVLSNYGGCLELAMSLEEALNRLDQFEAPEAVEPEPAPPVEPESEPAPPAEIESVAKATPPTEEEALVYLLELYQRGVVYKGASASRSIFTHLLGVATNRGHATHETRYIATADLAQSFIAALPPASSGKVPRRLYNPKKVKRLLYQVLDRLEGAEDWPIRVMYFQGHKKCTHNHHAPVHLRERRIKMALWFDRTAALAETAGLPEEVPAVAASQ